MHIKIVCALFDHGLSKYSRPLFFKLKIIITIFLVFKVIEFPPKQVQTWTDILDSCHNFMSVDIQLIITMNIWINNDRTTKYKINCVIWIFYASKH